MTLDRAFRLACAAVAFAVIAAGMWLQPPQDWDCQDIVAEWCR